MDLKAVPWELVVEGARAEVEARVSSGLAVRVLEEGDPFAGRCGAARSTFVVGENRYCRSRAGTGTDHKGWGRCYKHEGVEEGLPPWYGVVSRPVAQAGNPAVVPGSSVSVPTHGATALATRNVREIFARYLDEEELALFDSAVRDPKDLLAVVMGVRSAALLRITKYTQMQRLRSGGVVTAETLAAEAMADRTSQTIARLAEARKAFLELEAGEKSSEKIRGILGTLSNEDFARLKRDPRAMAQLIAAGGI